MTTTEEEDEDNEYAGSSRPDGFLAEESSDADEDSQASDADDDNDSDGRHVWSNVGVAIAALAALLSALSLTVSVATYLRPPQQAIHPSPPLRGTACASGQALLAFTRTEPAHANRMRLCVSEPVRWEPMLEGAVCKQGGIRVALEEGGAAELCGIGNESQKISQFEMPGRADTAKAADGEEGAALVTSFITDEAVRIGQVVSLSPKGGVAPYRLFRNIVWKQHCRQVVAASVGGSMFVSLCTPAEGGKAPLLRLCSAQHQDAIVCGRPVSAVPKSVSAHAADDTLEAEVLLVVGAHSRALAVAEDVDGLRVVLFGAHDGALGLTEVASSVLPLNWTCGERASGTLLGAILLSRSHFAVALSRATPPANLTPGGDDVWVLCGLVNNTRILCGHTSRSKASPRTGRVLDLRLAAIERDRLAIVRLVESSDPPARPPSGESAGGDVGSDGSDGSDGGTKGSGRVAEERGNTMVELTVLEGIGGGGISKEALTLITRGVWRMPGALGWGGRGGGGEGGLPLSRLDVAVLTPSKIVVTWASALGGVEAAVVVAGGDWARVTWSPRVSVLAPIALLHDTHTFAQSQAHGVTSDTGTAALHPQVCVGSLIV